MFEIKTIKNDIEYILGELSLIRQREKVIGLENYQYDGVVERVLRIYTNIEILDKKQIEYKKIMRQKALKDLSKILREDN